jgi:ribosome-associated translation inhibitor RaiA
MSTTMNVYLHTDHHVVVDAELAARIEANVGRELARFAGHVTRVDVHLTRQGEGTSVRCAIEARRSGLGPVAVSQEASNATAALDGAVAKAVTALAHATERIEHRGDRETIRGR